MTIGPAPPDNSFQYTSRLLKMRGTGFVHLLYYYVCSFLLFIAESAAIANVSRNCGSPTTLDFSSEPGNVLIVNYIHGGSHWLVLRELGRILESRGHQVTYIMPLSDKFPADGVRNIIKVRPHNEDGTLPFIEPDGSIKVPCNKFWKTRMSAAEFIIEHFKVPEIQCRGILDNPSVLHRIKTGNFSLAIVDMLGNECVLALLKKFDIPTIGFYFPIGTEILSVFENPTLTPMPTMGFGYTMSFIERVRNVFAYLITMFIMDLYYMNSDRFIRQRIPDSPHSADIIEDLALIYLQGNPYVDYARQLPPNYRQLGCLSCKPSNPLPSYLDEIMDESGPFGVVLVSFGFTMVRPGEVPKEFLHTFIEVAKRMNETIIMNYAIEYPAHLLPGNMKVYPWLPIQDVLGHPKTKAFVSHCGFSSTMEAVYHAVPVVAIPIYFEQSDLARRVVEKGYGVMLDKFELTPDLIENAIREVTTNSSYKDTIHTMSSRLKQDEFDPRKQAIFWSEYVMKYRDTSHFKLPTKHLNRFQRYAVDVFLFYFACFYFALKIIKTLNHWWHSLFVPIMKHLLNNVFEPSMKLINRLKTE